MIDTHAHVIKEYYGDEIIDVIQSSEAKLEAIINSSTNAFNISEVVAIANENDKFYASIGIHPSEKGNIEEIKKNIINPKVVAVGEIGLDYYYQPVDKKYQLELFESQMMIAKEYNKPVVIHSREAFLETYEVLKKYPTVKGVIHCFGGSVETAKMYIALGYKLGIGGVLTFKNANLPNVIKEIDLKNIVVETDAPYITPDPYRGKKNYPIYVEYIYQKIADIKELPLDVVVAQIRANVSAIFDISL